jgi:putative ABC transport system permease protein
VELRGTPFTVIGVRQERVSLAGYNGDDRDKVVIPHTTFRDLRGWTRISFLFARVKDPLQKDQAMESMRRILGARYRFDPTDEDALNIVDYLAIQDMVHGMLDGNRYFNGIVGLLGLMVAMLGVMNVMYVMVEERTREIGIRMALGARPQDIIRERLFEGVLLTLAGGAVGLMLAAAMFLGLEQLSVGAEVRAYMGHPHLSLAVGGGTISILAISGCIAAWFPARRAAAMDPVHALREE